VITGPQLRAARIALNWRQQLLATRAKVPVSVVQLAESSPGEPAVTIAQLNVLMQVLRAAEASFLPPDHTADGMGKQP